jgi:hypothetical protein
LINTLNLFYCKTSCCIIKCTINNISLNTVHQLFMDLKKVYDSGKWVVLYNILNVFDVPMKLVGITNMCLNQTCGRVQVDEHMFDVFPTNPPIPTVKLMLEF